MQRDAQRAVLPTVARVGILLSSLALASCGRGDVVSERPPIDARPVRANPELAPLVGSYSGSVQIPDVGVATGVLRIDPSGKGTFFVSVSGVSRSGELEILSLRAGRVRGRALGQTRELAIQIEPDRLRLDVPGIGEVVLNRGG